VVWDILPKDGIRTFQSDDINLAGISGINDIPSDIHLDVILAGNKFDVFADGLVKTTFGTFDLGFADRAAIDAANPNGFRAILRTTPQLNYSYNGFSLNPLVRRRYRVLQGLRSANGWDDSKTRPQFSCRWEEGKTYHLHYNWQYNSAADYTIGVWASRGQVTKSMIDLFSLPSNNHQGSKFALFCERGFSRTCIFTARDPGDATGLNVISFSKTPGSVIKWNENSSFNSYNDLSQIIANPLGLNAYVMIEG
jgi:hypothetical protein